MPFVRLPRLSILAKILSVATMALVVLTGSLLLVVKQSVEAGMLHQFESEIEGSAKFHRYLVDQKGAAAIVNGKLTFGSWVANDDNSLVDMVKQQTKSEATLFQLIDGKLIRVSTTIMKADGSGRGVGTELVGPAADAFSHGQSFLGINPILGQDYIASYDLIKDATGKPIGYVLTAEPVATMYSVVSDIVKSVLILGIIVTVLGIGVLVFVVRAISANVRRVAQTAQQIASQDLPAFVEVVRAFASGDLTQEVTVTAQRVDISSSDELGAMARDFNNMIDGLQSTSAAFAEMRSGLRDLVGQVQTSAVSLASTSAQLGSSARQTSAAVEQVSQAVQNVAAGASDTSRGSQETNAAVSQLTQAIEGIARGAAEQARQVQAASATAVQMADGVGQVAAAANTVAEGSQRTRESAEHGAEAVRATVAGMAEVKEVVTEAAGRVEELGRLGERIGQVVETIDDIAEQTNLLALNAAIEAARAGEHGKGFAVVADEVRKLAERSSRETGQIAALIRDVQSATQQAVSAMKTGASRVVDGSAKADLAGQALRDILTAVDGTVQQVTEIAASAREMASASRQVVDAMQSISAVVEENTAATEEMSAQAGQVSTAIQSIAAVAEEQSASTEEVSASTEEMTAQVSDMTGQAGELAGTADQLKSLVARFKLEERSTVIPLRRAA